MRRLIVGGVLALVVAVPAAADSKRCAPEQQTVRADHITIGADGHALRAARSEEAAVRAERQPLHYYSRKLETRIAHNEEIIDENSGWESCVPPTSMRCKNEAAHYFKAVGSLARNQGLLASTEAQIAVFDAQLAALGDEEAQALEQLTADHAQLASDRAALEACQAG